MSCAGGKACATLKGLLHLIATLNGEKTTNSNSNDDTTKPLKKRCRRSQSQKERPHWGKHVWFAKAKYNEGKQVNDH
jgi:hypothetical protein